MANKKILIVDDSFLTRSMLKKFLIENGYNVIEANDGKKAIELIETEQLDCIITDLLMPNLGGIELLKALNKKTIKIPVIVFTANIQKKIMEKCKKLGALAFFYKPPKLDKYAEKGKFLDVLEKCTRNDLKNVAEELKKESNIIISERKIDILTELINIGMGRAAASLNDLLDSFISLQIPNVWVFRIDSIPEELKKFGEKPLFIVQQSFDGPFSGKVALIFSPESAKSLVYVVTGEKNTDIDSIKAETLCEIGNILINGVMGSICNVLECAVSFSLPNYVEKSIKSLLNEVIKESNEKVILIAKTCFMVEELRIEGHFLLLLDAVSFENLINAVEELEKKEL